MAKLIAVVQSEEHEFKSRQMPLEVEDKVKMVLQFPDICVNCGAMNGYKRSELDKFIQRFTNFEHGELIASTTTAREEIAQQLASLVPCVGCRKSVERLMDHIAMTGNPTLDPLFVTVKGRRCQLQLRKIYREDPKLLFALLYTHGDKIGEFVSTIPRSKKNKRCQLHSLDTQKTKSISNWTDLWELLSDRCKEEVLMIDYQKFMEAMIVYLEKHRFCIECKTKVLHAHGLLIGDDCKKKDKGFCPALYEGVEYCKEAKQVHVKNDKEFIASLIARAEPDLLGSRRERHAKTMDIAQEEVLTCLGSYLYVRFNRLLQKIRLEEQTWKQLFYIAVCCLRRNFEVTVEKKQGFSQLELLCSEFEMEEKTKEHKKEMKKQKKKKSKQNKKKESSPPVHECDDEDSNSISQCEACMRESQDSIDITNISNNECLCDQANCHCDEVSVASERSPTHTASRGSMGIHLSPYCSVKTSASDLGYSSGPENCDSCSASSNSTEVTESANGALDQYCSRHNTGPASLDQSYDGLICDCEIGNHRTANGQQKSPCQQLKFHSTLEEMLEPEYADDDEESEEMISEEDIAAFKANESVMNKERLELREKLKQQFDRMKKRHCCNSTCSSCAK